MRCAGHEKSKSDTPTWPNAVPARTNDTATSPNDQMLRLPRKLDSNHHIWNAICNARGNRDHPPTSPNTVPATQNCAPKSKRNLPQKVEASFARRIQPWSEHDPTMNSSSCARRFAEVTFSFRASEINFSWKIITLCLPAIFPKFTKCFACHEKRYSDITKCCVCHRKWHRNINKCCACHEKWEGFHDGS